MRTNSRLVLKQSIKLSQLIQNIIGNKNMPSPKLHLLVLTAIISA